MNRQEKRKRVSEWVFQEFSLDKQGLCMLPATTQNREHRIAELPHRASSAPVSVGRASSRWSPEAARALLLAL